MSGHQKQQLEILKYKQLWFTSLIFLFVIVITWIGVSIFASQNKLAVSKDMKVLASPLTPTLNMSLLADLEKKKFYTENELASFPIYRLYTDKETDKTMLVEIGEVIDERRAKKQFVNPAALDKAIESSQSSPATRSGITE